MRGLKTVYNNYGILIIINKRTPFVSEMFVFPTTVKWQATFKIMIGIIRSLTCLLNT